MIECYTNEYRKARREHEAGGRNMIRPQSPCKGCKDRQLGCHTDCRAYIEFKTDSEDYKDQLSEAIGGSKRVTYNKRRQTKVWGIKC